MQVFFGYFSFQNKLGKKYKCINEFVIFFKKKKKKEKILSEKKYMYFFYPVLEPKIQKNVLAVFKYLRKI